MRKLPLLAVASAVTVVAASATAVTAVTADAATTAHRSPVSYVGTRTALSTHPSSSPGARTAAPANGPAAIEIKDREIEAEESAPEGGSAVEEGTVAAPSAGSVPVTTHGSGVVSSFEALNHFDSRYSGNGNAFSGEPPDQGLCVGGDYVFEIVNSVVQVYNKYGDPLIAGNKYFPDGPDVGVTLNEFYGLPPAIDRASGTYGPFMFDTSCLYDSSTQRWFVTSANLDQDPQTGDFSGDNQVWLAVSTSANPLGSWKIWAIDTANNGQNGTPDHGCEGGFCFGDYPQIGLDAHGFYLTTNEFELFGDAFNGAQVYALSKTDLVAGAASPTMQMFENVATSTYSDVAYTLQPVNALPSQWSPAAGGSMFFGMSGSAYTDGVASSIALYGLSHTSSLETNSPALALRETSVGTEGYATPTYARQKNGTMPLLNCVNDVNCIGASIPFQKPPLVLDAGNSSKVYGAWLHGGNVYLTAGTSLKGSGAATFDSTDGSWQPIAQRTGVAWFVLRPKQTGSGLSASLKRNGYVAVKGANLTYPSIVVGPTGAGAIGATLVGPGYYPSAAVARFAPGGKPQAVQVTGAGAGPNDGFTATAVGGYDPRWGDYGAATVTPSGVMWLASEYTAQQCSDAEFAVDTTCGYTRTFYANWSTHITAVRPLG